MAFFKKITSTARPGKSALDSGHCVFENQDYRMLWLWARTLGNPYQLSSVHCPGESISSFLQRWPRNTYFFSYVLLFRVPDGVHLCRSLSECFDLLQGRLSGQVDQAFVIGGVGVYKVGI